MPLYPLVSHHQIHYSLLHAGSPVLTALERKPKRRTGALRFPQHGCVSSLLHNASSQGISRGSLVPRDSIDWSIILSNGQSPLVSASSRVGSNRTQSRFFPEIGSYWSADPARGKAHLRTLWIDFWAVSRAAKAPIHTSFIFCTKSSTCSTFAPRQL